MSDWNRWFLIAYFALAAGFAAPAATQTRARLAVPADAVQPGGLAHVRVVLSMAPGWHSYWRNPGDSGAATSLEWSLPPGLSAGPIAWPVPHKVVTAGLTTYALDGEVNLGIQISVAPDASPGIHPIQAKVKWLECSDTLCVPQSAAISGALQIQQSGTREIGVPAPTPDMGGFNPQLTAQWSAGSAPTGSVRRIELSWRSPDGTTSSDFYPYESEGYLLRSPVEGGRLDGSTVRWEAEVENLETAWPVRMQGLIIARGSSDTVARAMVVEAEIPDPPRLDPAVGTPAGGRDLVGGITASSPVWGMLVAAFLGGLILNVMPCVLPVISLKILGFVRQSGDSPGRVRRLGLAYALGVWASFMIIAGGILALQAAGKAVAWGMQFGNPVFLVVLTTLVTLLALSLFGVFEITLGGLAQPGSTVRREGFAGAFFNGLFAVVLGTSCTAPFLGSAVGYALTQDAWMALAVFNLVAVGFALPYVLACWNPSLLRLFPKPGPWMDHFKVAMGFPMLATAVWLFLLMPTHYGDRTLWLGFFLIMLSAATWVYGSFIQRTGGGSARAWAVVVTLVGVGYGWALEHELRWRERRPESLPGSSSLPKEESAIDWKPWSHAAVEDARAQGRPVFVDFTADWCPSCKINYRTSISIEPVIRKLKEINAVALLADYTDTPDEMTRELEKWKRFAVPLVLVYPSDASQPARVLPELLTPSVVLDALEWAGRR